MIKSTDLQDRVAKLLENPPAERDRLTWIFEALQLCIMMNAMERAGQLTVNQLAASRKLFSACQTFSSDFRSEKIHDDSISDVRPVGEDTEVSEDRLENTANLLRAALRRLEDSKG